MDLGQKRGIFAWYDCNSTNISKSAEFYTQLFAWTKSEFEFSDDDEITVFANRKKLFANLNQGGQHGVKSHWLPYLAVDDVKKYCTQVTSFGGRVVYEPVYVHGIGQAALIEDPCRAQFLAFSPIRSDKMEPAMGQDEGYIFWNELMVDDPEKAWAFYQQSFCWKGVPSKIQVGDRVVGSIVKRNPELNLPPAWRPYVVVKDLAGKEKLAQTLGAHIRLPKETWGEAKHRSLIDDPLGASFFLVEL